MRRGNASAGDQTLNMVSDRSEVFNWRIEGFIFHGGFYDGDSWLHCSLNRDQTLINACQCFFLWDFPLV